MKWTSLILVSVFVGTFSLFGCGGDASKVCDACDARQNECEEAYNLCISDPDPLGECDEIALLACEAIL